MSDITGYCSTLSITAQFCLMFSNNVISLDFFQILINIVKYSHILVKSVMYCQYISWVFHRYFILFQQRFERYFNSGFLLISVDFSIFRLFRVVSSVLYLLLKCVSRVFHRVFQLFFKGASRMVHPC